jgi:hypothetical protein
MKQINLTVAWTDSVEVEEVGYPVSDASASFYLDALTSASGSLVTGITGSLRELMYDSGFEFWPLDPPPDYLAEGEVAEPDPRGEAVIGLVYLRDIS